MWRYYDGWGRYWVRYYFSGAVYEVIWCLLFFLFQPSRANVIRIPILVFIGTCIVEFLQLWEPHLLEALRSTVIGAALMGTSFVWLQFPFYVLGTVLSLIILSLLANIN